MPKWIESEFKSFDGLTLFYRYLKPEVDTQNTLLVLHRGHEHSGRIINISEKLAEENAWCFSFDLRGHGKSDGERAWAPSFNTWVKDLNSFAEHIQKQHNLKMDDMIVVANSVGAVMAVSWILNYNPNIKGCILGAPAFSIKLYIPLALSSLKLLSKFTTHQFVTSYVKSKLLTRDRQQAEDYDNDSLITKKIGVNILVSLFETSTNCFKRLKDFETPVLIITAEKDVIVHNHFHKTFYDGISSSVKRHLELKDFKHAIFHEIDQQKLLEPCQKFIRQLFADETLNLPATIPTTRKHTVEEYQDLLQKGSVFKQLYYTSYRWLLTHIGKYSKGVATGLKYGFDSGTSLDYVYKNKAEGENVFGKLIDRSYLNSVGWHGIRTRKQHLKQTLSKLVDNVHESGEKPVILDVAAGGARYLFEIQDEKDYPIQLHLNDIDTTSLTTAKTISEQYHAKNISYFNDDIFSPSLNWSFETPPNIIVISGVFELYENNQQINRTLNYLFSLLQNEGHLIYTGQPWHPQIEMIGRLLNNRQGNRWVMRRRTQREMDQLVVVSGFIKNTALADDLGIFTVSSATKRVSTNGEQHDNT